MKKIVFTIARQYGSGGKTVGKMLADELGIPFYNEEILYAQYTVQTNYYNF